MDLYTSLVRLKREMNNGQLPPMTPLSEKAKKYLDPEFTIGMGALVEDAGRGLRCPVRECGVWRHGLTGHLNAVHRSLGGAKKVKHLLGIPDGVRLISSRMRENLRARPLPRNLTNRLDGSIWNTRGALSVEQRKRRAKRTGSAKTSVAYRNLRNICDAQLIHRLIDLEHKVEHSPTVQDAQRIYGSAFRHAVEQVYGSWNAAKCLANLKVYRHTRISATRHKYDPNDIYALLRGYYEVNGSLPSWNQVKYQKRLPALPDPRTIMAAVGRTSWPEAMRHVAIVIGVNTGRYAAAA